MKEMLKRQVLILPSVLTLGLIGGCAPVDSSYNQDNPPGPPVWSAPDPVYQTPRQYGGAPWIDLGYYDQPIEPASSSAYAPNGPEPKGSSTAAADRDLR